jgi:hypothetical protein
MIVAAASLLVATANGEDPPSDWTEYPVTYFQLSPPQPEQAYAALVEEATCDASCDTCCEGCGRCDCCCWNHCCRPLWSVRAGAIFLTRSSPNSSPIVRDGTDTVTLLNSRSFGFDWVSGPDIELTRRVDRTYALDGINVRYFGVASLAADNSIDTVGTWRFPNSAGTESAAVIDSLYRSQLYSFELNAAHNIDCTGLTWLAGFRWVQLNDQLHNAATASGTVNYNTTTQNNLYGAQIGLIVNSPPDAGPFSLRWTSKAGVYGNAARNYWTADSVFLSGDSQGQLAFVGDVNVIGTLEISEHVSLQGGYQLLWVEDVAVAGDQFAVMQQDTTQTGIKTTGGAFFHGALASVNIHW